MAEAEKIEVKQTGGIGALFYAAIPAALGGAALMWLSLYTGIVTFKQEQKQVKKADTLAERMDNRVGVQEPLQNPVQLVIRNKTCLKVTRAFIDGDQVTMYVQNACGHPFDYWEYHWQSLAPDGTVIDSGWSNDGGSLESGETRELREKLKNDDRINRIVVFTRDHS